jgi:OmpA-OmpF porin, OOP family
MLLKKIALAALMGAGVAASSAAMAQATPDRGWYVGGSLGQMKADGDCPSGFSCDLKDTSWKVFGGYRINRNFAAEAFWGEWGKITLTSGPVRVTGELRTIGVAGLGILPLGQQFELFGKLGIGNSNAKATGSAPGVSISDRDSGSDLLFGFGATYNVTRNFGVRAEWERLNDSDVDVMSVGVQYRF